MAVKLTRAQMTALTKKLVKETSGCPLCLRPWHVIIQEAKEKGRTQAPFICDHDHDTGFIRGVLCRGCNGAEGKVKAAVASWGKQGDNYATVLPWLVRMIKYLSGKPTEYVYPTHLSEEEKKRKAGDRRRLVAQARSKARRAQLEK